MNRDRYSVPKDVLLFMESPVDGEAVHASLLGHDAACSSERTERITSVLVELKSRLWRSEDILEHTSLLDGEVAVYNPSRLSAPSEGIILHGFFVLFSNVSCSWTGWSSVAF